MGKIAFMFPGQGAQIAGMGQDFYEKYDSVKEIFKIASKASGLDVESLCFEKNDKLDITEYTQTALLTTEVAILRIVEEMGLVADYCLGLSLGEYGALAASKVMKDEDLISAIRKRGIYMQEAYPTGGAMMAILALDVEKIKEVLVGIDGIVSIANDNCPGQIVITGEEVSVAKAGELLKEAGAKRCIPLNVSGPFHSDLLKGAGEKLQSVLKDIEVSDPKIPYVSNVTADLVTDSSKIKDLLVKQVYSSVRFRESILKLKEFGVTTFVEIGPGKTLSGFVKKIDSELTTVNISKVEDLEKIEEIIKEK